MDNKIKEIAIDNFLNKGYSCSESIVQSAIEAGYVPRELLSVATSFSGGMGSGCLCGAIAGSQIVIGYLHGKNKTNTARVLAKNFIEEFKKSHRATCCRVLTAGFDFHSPERKKHCANMVASCAEILEKIMEQEESKV